MSDRHKQLQEMLLQDLAELKLTQIAETYREVLDEAARKNTSMLDVLAALIAAEVTARRQRALERRIWQAKLPKRKTLEEYNFDFPKRIPKQGSCGCSTATSSPNAIAPCSLGRPEREKRIS